MSTEDIRMVIVDDGEAMRRVLRIRLASLDEVEVVGEAATVSEAVKLVAEYRPEVVLLSGTGSSINLADAVRKMKGQYEDVKIVVLAPYEQSAAEALKAGASAHLLKETDIGILAEAIRRVVKGEHSSRHWWESSA